jgi:hypothetical protein
MQYAILLYADARYGTGPGNPEWDASLPFHTAFVARLAERGVPFSGGALHGVASSTSLRVRDGERLVTDGPFAETREQLWGFYTVELPDLDAAIDEVAGLWEAEHGTVEIRPMIPVPAPAGA